MTAFNRPVQLQGLLDRMKEIGVERLYISIDGPRETLPDDARNVGQCLQIASDITWAREVHVQASETNLGCGKGMRSALDWFFSHEEQGIVLEDDILPNQSFFDFCSVLLDRYGLDDRVSAISGCCLVPADHLENHTAPYRFSRITHVWGWATWRRTWDQYEPDLSDWRSLIDAGAIWESVQGSLSAALYWGAVFESIRLGRLDTWDAQLVLASMRSGQLTATSNVNLTENRGFGASATHTTSSQWQPPPAHVAVSDFGEVPVMWDRQSDSWTHAHHFGALRQVGTALSMRDPYFLEFLEEFKLLGRQ